MSDFIEFQLPGLNKTILSKKYIVSVVYQNSKAHPNTLIVSIHGWPAPVTYSGKDAEVWYTAIRDELGTDWIASQSDPDVHEID